MHGYTHAYTHTRSICLCLPPTAIAMGPPAERRAMLPTTRMLRARHEGHSQLNIIHLADFYAVKTLIGDLGRS